MACKRYNQAGSFFHLKGELSLIMSIILFLSLALLFMHCNSRKTNETSMGHNHKTPLDIYVDTSGSGFHYQVMHQSKEKGYTFYVLKMTSQEWLNSDLVKDPIWWHWISIVVPHSVDHDTALMWIGGGSRNDKLPDAPDSKLLRSAIKTNSVTVGIHNIPNQPVTFAGDTMDGRYEDEIIAFGWRKFLENGAGNKNAEWLARLPMTRAVTGAMDVVSEFISNKENRNITNYAVAGASKRGWTTWTTAAVDDRVVAAIPMVIDLLNANPSFKHHWRNYGVWTPAIHDYVNEGIMDWIGSQEFDRLLEITEPYSYIGRYDMPKLIMNATGDQFFHPESWKFYWDDLKGEKYLRYVPNTGHSLEETDAAQTMMAFYNAVINDTELPDYSWKIEGSEISVETDTDNPPRNIKLWYAVNKEARDFRVGTIGETWKDSTIAINQSGKYNITLTIPDKGWKAYLVELTYNYAFPLKLTTGVKILPEKYPYKPFEISNPKGTHD